MSSADYGDLIGEVERLHAALRTKEQAAAALQVRNSALERELQLQSSTVQDVVLLQQRLAKANEEAISMGEGMRKAYSDAAALDNTLTHVQKELAATKHQLGETQHVLDEKTSQLQELHTYYASVLEAKESSLASLQGLLASQQGAMQEQQMLWDEQRTALQDSLHVLRDSADANATVAAKSTADAGVMSWRQELPRGRWESKPQADLVVFLEGKVDRLEREKGALAQEKSDLLQEKSSLLQEKNDILQERSDLSLEVKELVRERGLLQRRLQGQEAQLESVESGRDLRLEEWEAKLEEVERKAARGRSELERRVHTLEGQLKDREKLLLKADKRYQELTRKHLALGNAFENAMASPLAAPQPLSPYAAGWPIADHAAGNRHKNGVAFPWASPALKHGSALGLDVGGAARDAQLSADALQHARAQLLEATSAREALQQQLQLIQEAFEEECLKSDQMHAKLTSKLKAKTQLLAEKDAELANKNAEVVAAKALLDAAQRTAEAGQKQVDAAHKSAEAAQQSVRDRVEAVRQRERKLQAEIDGLHAEMANMRAELSSSSSALIAAQAEAARADGKAAAEKAALKEAEARHAARVKDLEAQLHHLAVDGGPRSIAAEAELRQQRSLCARLEADLDSRNNTVQKLQHSLYVVRAHWGGLRQLLTRLHVVVQEAEEESKWEEAAQQQLAANVGGGVEGRNWGGSKGRGLDKRIEGIAADRQAHLQLDQLLTEWDPSSKDTFDAAAEASLGAASNLLEEATAHFQAMSRKAALARAASEGHAAQVASLAAQKEEATRTAHELQLQLTKERLESKAAEQSLLAAEATTAHAKQQAAAAQGELAEVREALHAEKRATQGALAEVSTASVQMAQLQAKLRDKMGQADGDLRLKQEEAVHAQRTITDLQTNVAALHVRLEQSQANIAQVDNLKARISSIMAQVAVPRTFPSVQPPPFQQPSQPTDLPTLAGAAPFSMPPSLTPTAAAAAAVAAFNAPIEGGSSVSPTAGSALSALQVDAELGKALESAIGQTQSVVAACALLEACHWELERGVAGVALAQGHLAGLKQELAAGRMSTALVMAQELQAIMDLPTSNLPSSSTPLALPFGSRTSHSPHKLGMSSHAPAGTLALTRPTQQSKPSNAMTTAAPNTNQTLGGYTAGPGGPGGHLSGDGAAGNAGPSGVIHVGKLQMDLEAARRAALHAAAGAKTAEGLLLGLRQALPEWMENMRATCHAQYTEELSRLRVLSGSSTAPPLSEIQVQQQQQQKAEDGLSSIRERMSMLQQEHNGLASECTSLQAQLLAVTRRGGELLQALQHTLPLPPELMQGLKDGITLHSSAHESHSSRSSSNGNVSGRINAAMGVGAARGGLEGAGRGSMGFVVWSRHADSVFSRAVAALQELVLSFFQQLEASGVAQGQVAGQQRAQQEVEPLRETCRRQQQQLAALQAQLQSLLHHAHQALDVAQAESAAAASGALREALESMRDEADEVQVDLQHLSKASTATWNTTLRGWQQGWQQQHTAAKQAINAVQSVAANLQGRLNVEVQEHQATREQGHADTAAVQDQAEEQANALQRAEAELSSLRLQLSNAQSAQEALVKETIARQKPASGRKTLSTVMEDTS